MIVTGLGGSLKTLPELKRKYKRANITVVKWYNYKRGMHKNYDYVTGHSMGTLVTQLDPTLPSSKLYTEGSPLHFRGNKQSGFFSGHNYHNQDNWWDRPSW